MKHIICDTIVLKDISEEEFNERNGAKEEEELLMQIANLCSENEKNDELQDAFQVVQDILFRMHRSIRAFGLFDNEEYVGHVLLSDHETPTPEIHVELDEAYRRRGIGSQALRLVIDEAFQNASVDFLIYRVHGENAASIALVEKCGGVLVETGSYIDEIIRHYHICRPNK